MLYERKSFWNKTCTAHVQTLLVILGRDRFDDFKGFRGRGTKDNGVWIGIFFRDIQFYRRHNRRSNSTPIGSFRPKWISCVVRKNAYYRRSSTMGITVIESANIFFLEKVTFRNTYNRTKFCRSNSSGCFVRFRTVHVICDTRCLSCKSNLFQIAYYVRTCRLFHFRHKKWAISEFN